MLLGADWALDDAWRIGVVGAKSNSHLDAKRFAGDLDSWHLGGYAVHQDGPLALRLGAIHSDHAGQNKAVNQPRDIAIGLADLTFDITVKTLPAGIDVWGEADLVIEAVHRGQAQAKGAAQVLPGLRFNVQCAYPTAFLETVAVVALVTQPGD